MQGVEAPRGFGDVNALRFGSNTWKVGVATACVGAGGDRIHHGMVGGKNGFESLGAHPSHIHLIKGQVAARGVDRRRRSDGTESSHHWVVGGFDR
jgi:hypothetical protein